MSLVGIVVVLVVAGLILWMINTYIPMAGAIKSLLNIVVFVVLLIWVLQAFGLIGSIPGFHMPALK
jgi:hypothetical protein